MRAIVALARFVAWLGLTAVGVLHAVWASGSAWPAKNRKQLAQATVGSNQHPEAQATAVVAATALVGGAVAAGALGEGALPVAGRRIAGVVLIARSALGGDAALKVLGLPKANKHFIELDNQYYRPLCAVLGVALLIGARKPRRSLVD